MADINTTDVAKALTAPSPYPTVTAPASTSGFTPSVSRYTAPPAPTVPDVPATPTAAPTLGTVDENTIRQQTADRMQSQIDAINANYADLITQENQTGQDRTGQTRAVNARSGTIGSDFGDAAATKTDQFNKQQVKSLQDEKMAKVAAVQMNIEDRASQAIRDAKTDALNKYNVDNAAYQRNQDLARGDIKTLATTGVTFNAADPAHQALLKQAGLDANMGALVWNSQLPKPQQIDWKSIQNKDGGVTFWGVDPTTGQPKTIELPASATGGKVPEIIGGLPYTLEHDANGNPYYKAVPGVATKSTGTGTGGGEDGGTGQNGSPPKELAPYTHVSGNGTTYVDLSSGLTPTQSAKYAQIASANGLPVILNKNEAADLTNIQNAYSNLKTMSDTFSNLSQPGALSRVIHNLGLTQFETLAQTNPQKAAAGVLQEAASDLLKAISGVQGGRMSQAVIDQIRQGLPTVYDTKDVAIQKITNVHQLIANREEAIVGKPPASGSDSSSGGSTFNGITLPN